MTMIAALLFLILQFLVLAFIIGSFWGGFQRLLVYQQRWRNTLFSTGYPILLIVLLLVPMLGWVIPPLGSLLSKPIVSSLYSALVIGLMLTIFFENFTNKNYFPFVFTIFVLALLSFLEMIVMLFYAFISISAFFSWRSVVQRGRYYSALPVANKIATTAQGNTVIAGQVVPQEGRLCQTQMSEQWVIWYRSYHLRPKSGDSMGFKTSRKEDGVPFFIDDGSGKCSILPKDARFYLSDDILHIEGLLTVSGDYEVSLAKGQTVYAYGDFRTNNNTDAAHSMGKDSSQKLCMITDLSPKAIAVRCQKVAMFHLVIFFLTLPTLFYTLFFALRSIFKY